MAGSSLGRSCKEFLGTGVQPRMQISWEEHRQAVAARGSGFIWEERRRLRERGQPRVRSTPRGLPTSIVVPLAKTSISRSPNRGRPARRLPRRLHNSGPQLSRYMICCQSNYHQLALRWWTYLHIQDMYRHMSEFQNNLWPECSPKSINRKRSHLETQLGLVAYSVLGMINMEIWNVAIGWHLLYLWD